LEKDRYIGFKATDFVLDQDFIAWTDGFERDTEPAWQEWLEQHPIEAIEVEKARQILMSLHFSQKEFIAEEVDQEWQQIKSRISEPDVAVENDIKVVKTFPLWAKLIAASVALLILTWIGRNYMYPSDGTPLLTEQQAANGQQLTIKLTDGTVIQLNAGSTLIYPDKFLADKREVRLKGEAYFEVAPDATAPFLIYTDDVRVKVIGTKFTVKAYPESKDVKVAVVEGMVAVNLTVVKGKKEIVETTEANLIKDEMATIVKKDQQLKISAFDKNDLLGWKNGILYFEKASFPQIVEQLERWYRVKVTVQARIEMDSAWRFSGKFENKSIDYILDVCSYPNQFKYEIIDNEVIIK
jgi:ferric-dicitrate binding protein FerR (iron transport regulator)